MTFSEGFVQGAADFRSILSKVRASHSDAIFLISHDEVINFMRQRKELGMQIPVYTTPVFEDARNLQKLKNLANGIVYTYYGNFDVESADKEVSKFVTSYSKMFNDLPTYYAALAYDATNILIKSLERSNFEVEAVKESLYQIRLFRGVTGVMSFDKNGDIQKVVSLKNVENRKFRYFDRRRDDGL